MTHRATIKGWSYRLCISLFVTAILWTAAPAQASNPLLKLSIGGHRIEVEVAATPEARDLGLMYRNSLPSNRGMLFIFPEAHAHCMWMKNTYIPLSVAFIDGEGRIVNMADMQIGSVFYYCAAKPVRHVLEMNEGWFIRNRIGPGSRFKGIMNAPGGR